MFSWHSLNPNFVDLAIAKDKSRHERALSDAPAKRNHHPAILAFFRRCFNVAAARAVEQR
jgi:hypothetical protein